MGLCEREKVGVGANGDVDAEIKPCWEMSYHGCLFRMWTLEFVAGDDGALLISMDMAASLKVAAANNDQCDTSPISA